MFNYGSGSSSIFDGLFSSIASNAVISLVCAILAVIGGIVLHFTFLSKKNEEKFTGFLGWLYDFLSFKKLFSEFLLQILYLIFACWITLSAIGTLLFTESGSIGTRLLIFILTVTIGNIKPRSCQRLQNSSKHPFNNQFNNTKLRFSNISRSISSLSIKRHLPRKLNLYIAVIAERNSIQVQILAQAAVAKESNRVLFIILVKQSHPMLNAFCYGL